MADISQQDISAAINNAALQLTKYPITKCKECGGDMFVPAMVMRDVPGLVAGAAQIPIVPTPVHKVFRCANCGAMLESDREAINKIEENRVKAESTSKLII